MQKVAVVAQSMVILVLLGVVMWQRHQLTLKEWWQTWRAKLKRLWGPKS